MISGWVLSNTLDCTWALSNPIIYANPTLYSKWVDDGLGVIGLFDGWRVVGLFDGLGFADGWLLVIVEGNDVGINEGLELIDGKDDGDGDGS